MIPVPSAPRRSHIISIAVLVLAVWLLLSMVVQIGTGRVGVVTRFGKVTGRELTEGLNFKLPSPVEKVWVVDTRIQKQEASAQAASADLQVISSTLAVNFHLDRTKVGAIYRTVGPQYEDRILAPAIQEVFKATTAKYTASQLLTERPQVKEDARKLLLDRLSTYGIILDDLSIVNFDFSPEFNRAIEQKQIAQQDAERAGYRLESARKEAEAQELQKSTLSSELLQKMAIEKWDGRMPQYVGSGSVFNIPLSK